MNAVGTRAAWRAASAGARTARRSFAAAPAAAADAKKGAAAPAPAAGAAADAKKPNAGGPTVKGVAYLKDTPEPALLPAEQYPAWLAGLADRPKNATDRLAPADGRVFFKKTNLAQIKKDNFLKDKKR